MERSCCQGNAPHLCRHLSHFFPQCSRNHTQSCVPAPRKKINQCQWMNKWTSKVILVISKYIWRDFISACVLFLSFFFSTFLIEGRVLLLTFWSLNPCRSSCFHRDKGLWEGSDLFQHLLANKQMEVTGKALVLVPRSLFYKNCVRITMVIFHSHHKGVAVLYIYRYINR